MGDVLHLVGVVAARRRRGEGLTVRRATAQLDQGAALPARPQLQVRFLFTFNTLKE